MNEGCVHDELVWFCRVTNPAELSSYGVDKWKDDCLSVYCYWLHPNSVISIKASNEHG